MEVFIFSVLAGVIIGLFSGLLGIGGGTLMVPFFRLGFGMAAIEATATSLFVIIPTSLAGCIGHLRNKTCVPKLGLAAGIAGACTAPLGVWCASVSPAWLIMAAAGLIIAYSALTMLKKALRMPKTPKMPKQPKLPKAAKTAPYVVEQSHGGTPTTSTNLAGQPHACSPASVCSPATSTTFPEQSYTCSPASDTAKEQHCAAEPKARPQVSGKHLLIGALIGLVAGFASGYVGVGGGFIMIPLFISVLGVSMKLASGTSLLAVVLLGFSGVCGHAALGNIQYLAGIAMVIGSIPGALLGAWLTRYIPERKLRFTFSFFLFFAAAVLVINEVFIA